MGSVAFIAEKKISCRNSVGKPERKSRLEDLNVEGRNENAS
jgi:hypothetical protein